MKTFSKETRKKMSDAKKRNPTRFWLGKGDLLRKAISDLTSCLPDYIRDEVTVRDSGKCIYCGSAKRLHVHHKDGRDGRVNTIDPPNHRLKNLITVCPKCHEGIHNNHLLGLKTRWPESRARNLECETCGNVFTTSKWEADRGRKYCSRKCCHVSKVGRKLPRTRL